MTDQEERKMRGPTHESLYQYKFKKGDRVRLGGDEVEVIGTPKGMNEYLVVYVETGVRTVYDAKAFDSKAKRIKA